jgi:hypothetical protein
MNSYNGMMNNNLMGMMNGMNTMPQQDYLSRMSVNSFPRYDIIKVKGQNGADAFQMAPNSKVLLLDENDPLVWFVQTDGAGYKTVTPYTITPFQPAPPVDLNSLEQRLAALEEKMYAKSYNGANKQRKSNTRNEQFDETSNTAG